MLLLASGLNMLWILWKVYVVSTPSLHQFVYLDILQRNIFINLCFLLVLLALIYPCHKFRDSRLAQKNLPIVCVLIFVSTLIFDGYMAGSMSPATISGMMGVLAVGLVFFPRKIVYSMLGIGLFALGFITYQAYIGAMPYAPIFRSEAMLPIPFLHPFWLGSMLYFMTPIIICCYLIFDVTLYQWRAREKAFQELSRIDPLTHLLNRRSIHEHLLKYETPIQEALQPFCIILMDIDHFKNINDTYGHIVGDEVLTKVADVLKEHTRPEDLVGRFGGEEFIILTNTQDHDLAYQIAERCRKAIMQLELYSNQKAVHVTASFGIASWTPNTTIHQALHQADTAMYKAKSSGRNLVKFAV